MEHWGHWTMISLHLTIPVYPQLVSYYQDNMTNNTLHSINNALHHTRGAQILGTWQQVMGWGTEFYMVDPNIHGSSVRSTEFSENLEPPQKCRHQRVTWSKFHTKNPQTLGTTARSCGGAVNFAWWILTIDSPQYGNCTKFPKMWEPPQNCSSQTGDMKHVP